MALSTVRSAIGLKRACAAAVFCATRFASARTFFGLPRAFGNFAGGEALRTRLGLNGLVISTSGAVSVTCTSSVELSAPRNWKTGRLIVLVADLGVPSIWLTV